MIIYGRNTTHTNTEKVSNYKCESCGQINTTNISILSKYVHIYWIPLFPYGKNTVAVCDNCGLETTKKLSK